MTMQQNQVLNYHHYRVFVVVGIQLQVTYNVAMCCVQCKLTKEISKYFEKQYLEKLTILSNNNLAARGFKSYLK
jgi:hypothetical protein